MAAAALSALSLTAAEPDLVVVATTDVHGNFFPYNFIERHPWGGSMARVDTYVDSLRRELGPDRVLLLDNGDILQGQPPAYYYNFVDTTHTHLAAEVYKMMGVDAAAIGNHDVETGHAVYDRWVAECAPEVPVLGANVVDAATGEPYLKPYTVIERGGMRVAVLGMLTPAIPMWLPENLWSGLRFEDITESARYWAERIRREENPDVLIGLFHTGAESEPTPAGSVENAALPTARNVDGFDLIIFGHDHRRHASVVAAPDGTPVTLLNPANNARAVARADIRRPAKPGERPAVKGSIVDIDSLQPSKRFLSRFAPEQKAVEQYVAETVGWSDGTFASRDAFFGPSAFMDLIHRLQLDITGADISMAAPLSMDGEIAPGELTMADMFTLYKYENLLYVMELTGQEIKDYLEMSYAGWAATMHSPDDHMLLFGPTDGGDERRALATPYYNFDSAAGIDYTVDLTAEPGHRVTITGMSNGGPFNPEATYRVAVNSYRGNGGGNLLTLGAGIAPESLAERVVWATDHDLRYYLAEAIRRQGRIAPTVTRNWRFLPEAWVEAAAPRDAKILFKN